MLDLRTFDADDAPEMRWGQFDDKGLMLKMMETVLMWMLGRKKRTLY